MRIIGIALCLLSSSFAFAHDLAFLEDYFLTKRVIGELAAQTSVEETELFVRICGPFPYANGSAVSETDRGKLHIASEVVEMRQRIKAAGYPDEVWRPRLIEYEEEALELLQSFIPGAQFPESNFYFSSRHERVLEAMYADITEQLESFRDSHPIR